MLNVGDQVASFVVGQKIGEGSFGEIYAVRNTTDNGIYALKLEPVSSGRRILQFEIAVLRAVSPHPSFPHFLAFGETRTFHWCVMELLGPSLSCVLSRLPRNHLSISSGLRTVSSVLDALERLHGAGFIHRDIKPSNILLRRSRDRPVALIDFGLSRVYIDRKTGKHLPPRPHPGFRGTAMFASPNAHCHQDLSRRDDLISWYYLIIEIMAGPLPWKKIESRAEVLHLKRRLPIGSLLSEIGPQFSEIWNLISNLGYYDEPNYRAIQELLEAAMQAHQVTDDDEWDWHPQILSMTTDDARRDLRSTKSVGSDSGFQDERHAELCQRPLLPGTNRRHGCCCCNVS